MHGLIERGLRSIRILSSLAMVSMLMVTTYSIRRLRADPSAALTTDDDPLRICDFDVSKDQKCSIVCLPFEPLRLPKEGCEL